MIDVSVIIPYHRDRGHLVEAIASYEAQEFTGSSELILSHNPEFTLGQNLNAGVAKAKGKYIKVLHDDDLLTPNCLQDLFDLAEKQSSDVVFAQQRIWNVPENRFENEVLDISDISLEELLFENFIGGASTLYRTDMFRQLGGFDEELWTAEEYEFHLRCLQKGYRFNYLPRVVVCYRKWSESKSIVYRKENNQAREDYIQSIRERFA